MGKIITEKMVVDQIIKDWDRLFDNDLHFFRKEFSWLKDWRCDITAWFHMPIKEDPKYKAAIFIETKYQNSSRDLIYELRKAKSFVERHTLPSFIGVISDDFSDPHINQYLIENDIHKWKINIKDDDIETLHLEYIYDLNKIEDEIKDKI